MEVTDPEKIQEWSYLAWVPCITGRLQFRYLTPKFVKEVNSASPVAVKVIDDYYYTGVYFDTDTKDFHDNGACGKHHVFVVFEQNDYAATGYDGKVYLWTKSDGDDLAEFLHKGLIYLADNDDPTEWIAKWKELINRAQRDTTRRSEVTFTLERTGLIYFRDIKRKENDQILEIDHQDENLIANQSFFVVKQCLHKHKHHKKRDDTVTQAHNIKKLVEKYGIDNVGLQLIYDLKTALTDYNRSGIKDYEQLKMATGISCYLRSLIHTLQVRGILSRENADAEKEYANNTKDSIDITANARILRRQRKSDVYSSMRIWFLAFIAAIAPFIILFRNNIIDALHKECEPDVLDSYSAIFIVLFGNPKTLVIAALILVFLLLIFTIPRLKYPEPLIRVEKWLRVMDHSYTFSRRKSKLVAAAYISIGLVICGAALYKSIDTRYKYSPPASCSTVLDNERIVSPRALISHVADW